MPLFEIAIIKKPTKKELDEGTGQEELLFGPKTVLAKDEQAAGMMAVMGQNVDLNRSQVLIRPFA
jgi:hypothetical protein